MMKLQDRLSYMDKRMQELEKNEKSVHKINNILDVELESDRQLIDITNRMAKGKMNVIDTSEYAS